jgi:hypothetical protein
MHPQLRLDGQLEHHLHPRRQLPGGVARQLTGDAIEPVGERVRLLAQHCQEQLVLRCEMPVERPGRQASPVQDRGHRNRAVVRLGQTAVRSVDDALTVIGDRLVRVHDRRF